MKIKLLFRKKNIISFAIISMIFSIYAERAIISDINATISETGKVTISWKLPTDTDSPITSIFLYRATQPIDTYKILESLTPLATVSGESNFYIDSIAEGQIYYYAVILSTPSGKYDVLLPSINATVTGIQIPAQVQVSPTKPVTEDKLYPEGTYRETPLPVIGTTKQPHVIDNTARDTAIPLVQSGTTQNSNTVAPFMFEEDSVASNSGGGYLLFDIISQTFAKRDYNEAITRLEHFTGTNLEHDVILRGTFYLGQSYYYTGDTKNAIRCFLATSEAFPELSKKWIDYALDYIN